MLTTENDTSETESPQTRTHTHPTDVICWDAMPSESCAMEFRPASAQGLSVSFGEAWSRWLPVTCICGFVFWLLRFVILVRFTSLLNRVVLLLVLAAGLVAFFGKIIEPYRMERRKRSGEQSFFGISVILIAVLLVIDNVRLIGVAGYVGIVLPALIYLSYLIARHAIQWHTANPMVIKESRSRWREEVETPISTCVSTHREVRLLGIEALAATALVFLALLLAPTCYLIAEVIGFPTLSWWVAPTSALALYGLNLIWTLDRRVTNCFENTIGHWLLYQTDSRSSPLVFQSEAGNAARRTLLTWLVLAVLTCSQAGMLSNLAIVEPERQLVLSFIDTTIVAITSPVLLWCSVRVLVGPTVVAAKLIHDPAEDSTNEEGSK